MASLPDTLSRRIQAVAGIDPELRPATRPQFGHYQCNVALRLAAEQGAPPRQIAADLVARLDLTDLAEPLEIAGPGFINIRVRPDVLAAAVTDLLRDPALGVVPAPAPETVVVDYSSPNVAKQMHVGHLRSTIIGDCFTRVLRLLGHRVIPQNHIGDWGRQFGMLIEQILDEGLDLAHLDLAGAEALYLRANQHLAADPEFADRARARVVALQSGDEPTLAIWRALIEISETGFDQTYARLGVLLTRDDIAGESMYNQALPGICDDLESQGIATEDDGALVAFVPGFDAPVILRNSAGGYGYDVTDLAAIRHRVGTLGATRMIYVTDARQHDHFLKVFAVARLAGYLPEAVVAEHIGFGMVTGPDGAPFKTREGTAQHLDDLLDEAERLTTPDVALAAIKYADLSNQLQKDYVFDVARMTAMTGDTGPYLQYAHARVCQILRRAAIGDGFGIDWSSDERAIATLTATPITLSEPAEMTLALTLTRYADQVVEVGTNLTPHKLCGYLYELATALSAFYEQCPVLHAGADQCRSRLALCLAVRRVLAAGLTLLGIHAPETM